jgi:hypothetical protein
MSVATTSRADLSPAQGAVPAARTQVAGISVNRIVAFIGPFVAIVAGALAAWLGRHFPGLKLNETKTTAEITQAIEFAVGAGVTLLLHSKWLSGWQAWEQSEVARLAGTSPTPPASGGLPLGAGQANDG